MLTQLAPFNVCNLINWDHPLTLGLLDWWMVMPHAFGGTTWRNLLRPASPATLSNMSATRSATSGWNLTTRMGGFGDLRFDGTNDRITVTDQPRWTFASGGQDKPFSLSCALWLNSISATAGVLSKWQTVNATMEWIVYTDSTALIFQLYSPTTSGNFVGRQVPLTTGSYQNQWLSMAFTYTGSESNAGLKIYRNGRRVDSADNSLGTYTGMSDTTAEVAFGSYGGAANFLNGRIDDVRIYTRTLSDRDVLELYSNQLLGYEGLVQRVPLTPRLVGLVGDGRTPKAMYSMGMGMQAVHRASHY